jgi:hypothetical protein
LATTGAALAQERSGNVFVTVTDTSGAPLPGVTVELTGAGAPQIQVSNAQGEVRYLKLDPGRLQIKASLEGFSTVEYPNVTVNIGRNTSIEVQLSAAIEEVITVTSESPLLDERKLASGTTISQIELEKIPTARDPWAILTQAAGVQVDRINVGGGEGGQQAVFRGNAVTDQENDFLVDGVQITDMSAVGASPTYYQFDQFEEMQLSTGGNDVTKNTSGVSVNLVTKRGTNEFRGSARFLLTRGEGYFGALDQADSGFSDSDLGPGQPPGFEPNRINNIQDFGFEAGGPVWRDRVWLWASWGQNDINIVAAGGNTDRTVLEGTAVKLNAQFSSANSFVGSFNNGDKLKFGRGAQPQWDASATWNQRGPTGISKFEDTHVFGSNFFLSGQYSFVDGGFSLTTLNCSGPSCPAIPGPGGEPNIDENSFLTNNGSGGNSRPTEEFKIDGSYFFNTGGLSHELKFGGRTREASTESAWSYAGRNIYHYNGVAFGIDADTMISVGLPVSRLDDAHMVYAYRQGPVPTITNYGSAWVQDTMTMGQWTFNVGFRYDAQDGENKAGTVDANPAFPEFVPALDFGGNDGDGLSWTSITPRLGVTYALGEERKTLIRGSLSQFPDQMSLNNISRVSPVSGQWGLQVFLDSPGGFDSFYDEGETTAVFGGLFGFDPNNPTSLSSSNQNDPNMDAPITTEFIIGAEHAFLPEFVVGASVTWRERESPDYQLLWDDASGVRRTAGADEYVQDPLPVTGLNVDGSPYSVNTFSANPSLTSAGGTLFTNGDRTVDYLGGAINFTKRLTNQWMLRGFVNYNFTEEWSVPSSFFNNNDPNRMQPQCGSNCIGGRSNGQTFIQPSGGSGKADIWMQSTWQWNLNGMYQVAPDRHWGFNVAANLSGREGYPAAYYARSAGNDGIGRRILTGDVDDFRLDSVNVMDLRLEKEWRATGNTSLTFSIDAFNIFNDGTVLQRRDNVSGSGVGGNTGGWVGEVLSPRVWRLGVRLNWR